MSQNDYENVKGYLSEYNAQIETAAKLGRKLGKKVLDHTGTMSKAVVCGTFLDTVAQQEPDHECIELLLDWTFSEFWAIEVERHLPLFDKYWNWLHEHNTSKDNTLVWGDIDCSAWIEKPKDTNRKVIVIERHCAMRDDNIHLFIREQSTISDRFTIRTCWPKTVRSKGSFIHSTWDWIERASLKFYRDMDFKVNYNDCRDIDYCCSYERILDQRGKVDRAYTHMSDIYWALWALRDLRSGIEDPYKLPKGE